jgi:hypothetical protein
VCFIERTAEEVSLSRRLFCVLAALALAVCAARDLYAQSQQVSAVIRTRLTREISQKELVERGVDILHVYRDGRADLAVTDEQLHWITSCGEAVTVLERIDLAAAASIAAPDAIDQNLGMYYTYAEMNAALDSLALAYPTLAHLDTLGSSIEGRLIRAIKISDSAGMDEDEPEMLMMGCHHAREIMSVDVPLRFAKYLLEHYGTDPLVTGLVNTRELWIAPMINVDGHVYVEQNHSGSSSTWWRKNRRHNADGSYGIDLNRNYGYNWGYDNVGSSPTPSSAVYRGTAPFSEPEIQAVRDFCIGRHFVISVSYHSYGELILYPWGYAPLYTSDQDLYQALGDTLMQGNGYIAGCAASGAIYITNGDSDDWLYGDQQSKDLVYAFTIELNSYEEGGFAPPESLILPTFENVLGMSLAFLGLSDNPHRILGPEAPVMNPVTTLNPPSYEISWSAAGPQDPNPPVSYELTEIKNLSVVVDSVESGDSLWVMDGFTMTSARVYAGSSSFYSGRGNLLQNTVSMANIYPMWLPQTLTCRLWYDLEEDWDYAYLEGSIDGGTSWITVPGDRTTNDDPNGNNRGNGITGFSGGWVSATFNMQDLMLIESGAVLLRFICVTDESINNEGIYIDLVAPVARAERSSVIASGYPNTWYHRWPDELGSFIYYVRAFDAQGQASKLSDLAAHVVDDLSAAPPSARASSLGQNYPNPFNPTTTLRFNVGTADAPFGATVNVGLRLYDVSGRTVAVLREGRFSAGTYSVTWGGLGMNGKPVSSGIYFAELRIGARVFVQKMVLLR